MKEEIRKILLEALLDDEPFAEIRKKIGVGKKRDLGYICEYEGGKIWKAFQLHKNNQKQGITKSITPDIFLRKLEESILKLGNTNGNAALSYEEIEVIELPKVLPERLLGENRKALKQTSVKVVENVWVEFQEYSKSVHMGSIELVSLALLELMEKYKVR